MGSFRLSFTSLTTHRRDYFTYLTEMALIHLVLLVLPFTSGQIIDITALKHDSELEAGAESLFQDLDSESSRDNVDLEVRGAIPNILDRITGVEHEISNMKRSSVFRMKELVDAITALDRRVKALNNAVYIRRRAHSGNSIGSIFVA